MNFINYNILFFFINYRFLSNVVTVWCECANDSSSSNGLLRSLVNIKNKPRCTSADAPSRLFSSSCYDDVAYTKNVMVNLFGRMYSQLPKIGGVSRCSELANVRTDQFYLYHKDFGLFTWVEMKHPDIITDDNVAPAYNKVLTLANEMVNGLIERGKTVYIPMDTYGAMRGIIKEALNRLKLSKAATVTNHEELIKKVEELILIYGMEWKSVIMYTSHIGWIHDPCGLIYIDGTYHLFYQLQPKYYPHTNVDWGHATSNNLVTWDDKGIAMSHTDEENILGGSAIYDENNTNRLGTSSGPIVLTYASRFNVDWVCKKASEIHVGKYNCAQNIAFSEDKGITWTKYDNNPIIWYPPQKYKGELRYFRDPTIFWYENKWVLVVILYRNKIAVFYESNDLRDWTCISEFSLNTLSESKEYKANWECPDIFEMNVEGQDKTKWVFILTLQNEDTDSVYYIIGQFNGTHFIKDDTQQDDIKRLDYGSDFFAAKTWNNVRNHRYIIGWVNNWAYAEKLCDLYRGGLSLVRELHLIEKAGDYKLIQNPVKNIENYILHTSEPFNIEKMKSGIEIIRNNAYNFIINVKQIENETTFSLVIRNADKNNYEYGRGEGDINYNAKTNTISIQKYLCENPEKESIAKLDSSKEMKFSLFIDNNSLTLFCNNGETVFTELLVSTSEKRILRLVDKTKISTLDVFVIQKLLGMH